MPHLASSQSKELKHAASAKHNTTRKTETPYFVLNVAGVDRLLQDLDFVGGASKRPEWPVSVRALLALAGELKGIDRTRPFGVMAFVNPGEAPEPVAVAYVPITSIGELRQTLKTYTGFQIDERPDANGIFVLKTATDSFCLVVRNRYAFLARRAVSLQRAFGDPAKRFSELTRNYDVVTQVYLSSVPLGMKTMILDYLRAQAESKAARRQGETQQRQRLRKAATDAALDFLTQIANGGKRLEVGVNLAGDRKQASFDVRLDAIPKSKLSQAFSRMASGPTQTSRTATGQAPLSASVSWAPGKLERSLLQLALHAVQRRDVVLGNAPMLALVSQIAKLVAGKQLVGRLQLLGDSHRDAVLIGSVKSNDAKAPFAGFAEGLDMLKRQAVLHEVKPRVAAAGETRFRHFQWTSTSKEVSRVFGENPSFVTGINKGEFRIAIGKVSHARLQQRLLPPAAIRPDAQKSLPLFRVAMNIKKLATILAPPAVAAPPSVTDLLRTTDATLQIEIRSDARSLSLRASSGTGLLRLLGNSTSN